MENAERIIEAGTELVTKANGNWKVIVGSAVATLAVGAGVYFGGKKVKSAIENRKTKKKVVTVKPEVVPNDTEEVNK